MIRFKFFNQLVLSISITLLLTSAVWAADWTKTFKEGVNSYTSSGQIRFHSGSKLFNSPTNGNLPSYSVTDPAKSACVPSNGNAKKCKAGRYTAELPSDRIPFAQCASTSNRNLGPSDAVNYVIEVAEGEYDTISSYYYYHTVKFSANDDDGIYKIKSLNVQDGTLEFAPGQYWIDDLQIAERVTVRFPPNGTVSLFVKNHFVQYNRLLPYYSDRFLLYGYSDIDLAEDSYFRGYIVSEGRLIFSEEAKVEGGVTSDYISIADDGWVQFDNEAWRINVVPNCDLDIPKPPVIPQCPAEQSNIQGLTYRTYDAESWDDRGDSPEDHDDFEELISQVKKTKFQIGESVETNLNQKGNGINPHSNAAADQDLYLGIFEGYIEAPETGEYTFAIDGDDAIELLIDGEVITGFYDVHATCDCTRYQGKVSLEQGAHTIELRFHEAFGAEAFRLYWQPPSSNRFEIVPSSQLLTCPAPQFEFGRAELDANGNAVINFDNTYSTAPVIMVMPTIDGGDANTDRSSTVRVDSLSSSNASIKQVNSDSSQVLDKKMDKIDYFVMERGYRFLERGKALQAGSISTELYQGKNLPSSGRGYENIEFEHDFGLQPAMIGQVLTHNNNRFITTVINNVDTDGSQFDIAIEGSEISSGITRSELLGYVAGVGQGVMTVNGENLKYEFANGLNHGNGSSTRTLSQQCAFNNNYQQTYSDQPLTIANKNQRRGADGGWVRRCTKESFNNQVSFAIDEDQHGDGERSHLAESIGYFAFEYAPDAPAVNHYRINFDSGALSCAAKSITLQ
ncbi:PA14 domain-containing protein, partial [Shewanella sp. 0m-11]